MAAALDTQARIARLLARTGFGRADGPQDPGDDFDAVLDAVLGTGTDDGTDDDPGVRATPAPRFGTLPQRPGPGGDEEERRAYARAVRAQREEIVVWWLDRMCAAERPWTEKRTFLWHGHWATSVQKVKSGDAMLAQNATLRRLGGGDFRVMAREMVRDPALMVWLDASGNTAEAPNENLARELMELFVLGVGNYTETDVREAAKSLTGWSVDRGRRKGGGPGGGGGYTARFQARKHASGTQEVLGEKRDFDAKGLVDLLVEQPACAEHLARRWWRWLVSGTDGPSEESLRRMTDAYGPRRDVTAMLRALFTDPAFADPGSVLVKQPVEYVVGTLRALGVRPSKLEDKPRRQLLRALTGMGQLPFAPPDVGGWPSGEAWLTTAAARTRIGFAQQVVQLAKESDAMRELAGTAPGERPAALAALLGVGEWGAGTQRVLAAASEGGAAEDASRVTAIALTAPEHLVLR